VSANNKSVLNGYTGPYDRWDLAVQQKLTNNIQFYVNYNNLTNTHDESVTGYGGINPTALQYYGKTIDAGIRVSL
jgi:outer membrane receptor protein involved in Fe transport